MNYAFFKYITNAETLNWPFVCSLKSTAQTCFSLEAGKYSKVKSRALNNRGRKTCANSGTWNKGNDH